MPLVRPAHRGIAWARGVAEMAEVVDRHRTTLASVGLPTNYAGASWEQLLATMRIDKKSRGDLLRFFAV